MYSSELVSDAGVKVLSFEASPDLYVPVADWREREAYPGISSLSGTWREDQYRLLAWEFLRRTTRYRWHFSKLAEHGLLNARTFDGGQRFFSASRGGGPRSGSVLLKGHACFPAIPEPGETLATYQRRHGAERWWVQHGHDWACCHWSVSGIADPRFAFDKLPAEFFDSSPKIFFGDSDAYRPSELELELTHHSAVVLLRLDLSIDQQLKQISGLLTGAQNRLKGLQGTPKSKLNNLELAAFWLRTWDAFQEWRLAGKPPEAFDKKRVHDRFLADWAGRPRPANGEQLVARKRRSLNSVLDSALTKNNVADWLKRMTGYLTVHDDAYRLLLSPSVAEKRQPRPKSL